MYKVPRITITVPASVIMIPGAAMFGAMFALSSGDVDLTVDNAARVVLLVTSISTGLVLARLLTDQAWRRRECIDFSQARLNEEPIG